MKNKIKHYFDFIDFLNKDKKGIIDFFEKKFLKENESIMKEMLKKMHKSLKNKIENNLDFAVYLLYFSYLSGVEDSDKDWASAMKETLPESNEQVMDEYGEVEVENEACNEDNSQDNRITSISDDIGELSGCSGQGCKGCVNCMSEVVIKEIVDEELEEEFKDSKKFIIRRK